MLVKALTWKPLHHPSIKAVGLFTYLILLATFFNCLLYFYILKYIPFLNKFVKDCECNLICFPMQQGFRKDFLILYHEKTNILNRWLLDSSLHWLDSLFLYALSIQWNVLGRSNAFYLWHHSSSKNIQWRIKVLSFSKEIFFT